MSHSNVLSIVTNIVKNEFSSERMILEITILSAASINSDSASFLPRSACSRPSRSSSISAFIGDYNTKINFIGGTRLNMISSFCILQMMTCHFTANSCCETFPECCETFPICNQTFSVYGNSQDKVKGWVSGIF